MDIRGPVFLLWVAVLAPAPAFADGAAGQAGDSGRYYFGMDELRLRRDIADIRYFYTQPARQGDEAGETGDGFLFFSAGFGDTVSGPTIAIVPQSPGVVAPQGATARPQDVELWVNWRPDVTGGETSTDTRQMGRSLTGSAIDRIGVRADVTALLFDESGAGTTAWRVTGALGSTSLSLVTGEPVIVGGADSARGLLWDVGVGWSSGPVSLNAGYQSTAGLLESGGDIAVLSLGADYAVLPGLSVYGELNVIDDTAATSTERLGTVFILGTGLNF